MPKGRRLRHVRIGGQIDLQRRYGNKTCAAFTKIRPLFPIGNFADRPYPINLFAARIAGRDDVLLMMPSAQTGNLDSPDIFRCDSRDVDIPQDGRGRRFFKKNAPTMSTVPFLRLPNSVRKHRLKKTPQQAYPSDRLRSPPQPSPNKAYRRPYLRHG